MIVPPRINYARQGDVNAARQQTPTALRFLDDLKNRMELGGIAEGFWEIPDLVTGRIIKCHAYKTPFGFYQSEVGIYMPKIPEPEPIEIFPTEGARPYVLFAMAHKRYEKPTEDDLWNQEVFLVWDVLEKKVVFGPDIKEVVYGPEEELEGEYLIWEQDEKEYKAQPYIEYYKEWTLDPDFYPVVLNAVKPPNPPEDKIRIRETEVFTGTEFLPYWQVCQQLFGISFLFYPYASWDYLKYRDDNWSRVTDLSEYGYTGTTTASGHWKNNPPREGFICDHGVYKLLSWNEPNSKALIKTTLDATLKKGAYDFFVSIVVSFDMADTRWQSQQVTHNHYETTTPFGPWYSTTSDSEESALIGHSYISSQIIGGRISNDVIVQYYISEHCPTELYYKLEEREDLGWPGYYWRKREGWKTLYDYTVPYNSYYWSEVYDGGTHLKRKEKQINIHATVDHLVDDDTGQNIAYYQNPFELNRNGGLEEALENLVNKYYSINLQQNEPPDGEDWDGNNIDLQANVVSTIFYLPGGEGGSCETCNDMGEDYPVPQNRAKAKAEAESL